MMWIQIVGCLIAGKIAAMMMKRNNAKSELGTGDKNTASIENSESGQGSDDKRIPDSPDE